MPKRSAAGFIYAIQAEGSPYVKIGSTSASVEKRLKSLQAGQPLPLRLIAHQAIEADLSRIERQIHHFLATERQRGEWFALKLDADELAALIQRAVEYLKAQDIKIQEVARKRHPQESASKLSRAQTISRFMGNVIRSKREAAGLTMAEVARRAKMHHTKLWKIEHGERRLMAADVLPLAQAIGCDPRDLLPALEEGPSTAEETTANA